MYLETLSELQDRLPSFPNEIAWAVVEEELGVPVASVYEQLSEQPVAAASLGQVGTRGGGGRRRRCSWGHSREKHSSSSSWGSWSMCVAALLVCKGWQVSHVCAADMPRGSHPSVCATSSQTYRVDHRHCSYSTCCTAPCCCAWPRLQVYKGVLRETGELVAVKVQRPGIGESIAVDMLLLRRLMAVVDKNLTQVRRGD